MDQDIEKMKKDFLDWVRVELGERGWTNVTLIKKGKRRLKQSTVSEILNGKAEVSFNFCLMVADAFGYPVETVLRKAALIPPAVGAGDPRLRELFEIAANLSEREIENALEYLRWRYRQQQSSRS